MTFNFISDFDSHATLFTSDEATATAIRPIVEALFDELGAFGRLMSGMESSDRPDERVVVRYLRERAAVTLMLLQVLEIRAGLRFRSTEGNSDTEAFKSASRRIPFCYNRADWPDDGPLAGYSDSPAAPLPHQVVRSMIGNWRLDTDTSGDGRSSAGRMLLSALWICASEGLIKAIAFLLDLQVHGFAPSKNSLGEAITMLVLARNQADSEEDMLTRFLGGSIPPNSSDWLQVELSGDWVEQRTIARDQSGVISFLLTQVISQVDRVRAARNRDDWVLGCADVQILIHTLNFVVDGTGVETSVTFQAVLAQLEEVEGDASGAVGFTLPMAAWVRNVQLLVGNKFQEVYGDQWKEHLYRERLIVPAALRSKLFGLEERVPDGWIGPSWRLAHPISLLAKDQPPLLFRRFGDFDADDVLSDRRLNEFFEEYEIQDPLDRRIIAEDSNLWRRIFMGYPMGKAEEIIREIRLDLSRKYLDECIYDAQALGVAGDYAGARARLEAMVKFYPWAYPIWWQLAITFDELGLSEYALSCIGPAIFLRADFFDTWQSLSVILGNLEREEEAFFASVLSRYFAEREG